MDGRFEAFSTTHYLVLALFAACVPLLVWQGRRVRTTAAEKHSRRIFAAAIVGTAGPLQLLQFTPGDWNLNTSLPLHLCDLAWIAAAYALWSRRPWAVALTYYWGLTLTSQAMITPSLGEPFPDLRFIGYWAMHSLIIWAAIYMTAGLGIRPTWRLYGSTVGLTALWAVAVMMFNFVFGTNYGYLNDKPGAASILDVLGPWPWYVLAEVALATAVWAAITAPWMLATRRGSTTVSPAETG